MTKVVRTRQQGVAVAVEQSVAENLRRRLLSEISTGSLAPGARLGSERELAERYGVSRATLRQVFAALEEAGLVTRVPGRAGGTFVSHAKVDHDLTSLVGVPAYLSRQGYVAGTRVLSTLMTTADEPTAVALRLEPSALVVDIRRIRLADGKPISLDHARFPAERFPGLMEMSLGSSLYELLEQQFGTAPADAEEVIEVVHATDDEASLLSVEPGAALLAITRTSFDASGAPFEYSYDLFRADRTRISMRTPGSGLRSGAHNGGHYIHLSSVPDDTHARAASDGIKAQ
jgi:GntR family transcriptional regulator